MYSMKRVKTNYHTLQVLKTVDTKSRKANNSKCNKEHFNCISECVLNVLNGNIKLTGSETSKLQKFMVALRKVSDRRVPISKKKKIIVQHGGILLPLLSAILPTLASLIFRNHVT